MLLFGLDEKGFDKISHIPYQVLKEVTMEAWALVNGGLYAEKKTQELSSSKSRQPFPVYSPSEKSDELKATTKKE
jgi:hypothetical protein